VALAAYIFHQGDGEPIREFRKTWATACKEAGVSGRLFHDLRRTAVRNLVRAGATETVAVDTHGLTPVALAAEDDFVSLRVSAPSDSRERSAFTHGLTPVVLSGALMEISGHRTRAIFGRYNITSVEDKREALQRTQAYTVQAAAGVAVLPVAAAQAGTGRRIRTVGKTFGQLSDSRAAEK
jgi:hypothetical protein